VRVPFLLFCLCLISACGEDSPKKSSIDMGSDVVSGEDELPCHLRSRLQCLVGTNDCTVLIGECDWRCDYDDADCPYGWTCFGVACRPACTDDSECDIEPFVACNLGKCV
jgi:hypothetical protein